METTQRETKEVKVGKHTLIVNTYITGREARDIEGSMMDKIEMNQSTTNGMEITGFKASHLKDKQDLQVKAVIVSFNGSNENMLDKILDLPSKEREKIMEIARDIAEPKKEVAGS